MSVRATARIDPRTLGGGEPLTEGVWEVHARVSCTGWTRDARLGADRADEASRNRRPALVATQVIRPYWARPHGSLSIEVGADPIRVLREEPPLSLRIEPATGRAVKLHVGSALVLTGPDVDAVRLRLTKGARELNLPAHSGRAPDGTVTAVAELPDLDTGRWTVLLEVRPGQRVAAAAMLAVDKAGAVRISVPRRLRPTSPRTPRPRLREINQERIARRVRRGWRALRKK